MAEETHAAESLKRPFRKRKLGHKKGHKGGKKKQKQQFQGFKERIKIDPRRKKFLQKKARDYNSDSDEDELEEEEEDASHGMEDEKAGPLTDDDSENSSSYEASENEDEEEEDAIQPGITKFSEGCRAFRIAFKSIMKKIVSDDSLGPVLSGHKKLVAEKLAEEETERKVKGEAKKEKIKMGEKGHVKPANYLDSHEKFLITVATKGVVKLFNAVNKAQNAQKGLDPSRTKDAKVLKKRRKEAFFSELSKRPGSETTFKVDSEGPSWAPLRDNYMLTNPKLKDWDKKATGMMGADEIGRMSEDSGSDDD